MVYGFANQSGGHANITSNPGTGTTANVYLPRFQGTTTPACEAQQRNPDLKVLLISGYPEFALESNCHMGTDWHLLKKPFGRADLRASLQLL